MKTQVIHDNNTIVNDDTEFLVCNTYVDDIVIKNNPNIKIIIKVAQSKCHVINCPNLYYVEGRNFILENIYSLKSVQISKSEIINCKFMKAYHLHMDNIRGKIFLPNNKTMRYNLVNCKVGNNLHSWKGFAMYVNIKQLRKNFRYLLSNRMKDFSYQEEKYNTQLITKNKFLLRLRR
jgi:hypothetical protein